MTKTRIILTTFLILAFAEFTNAADTVTLESLLAEMVDRDRLAQYPEVEWKSLQASSYNRKSVARDKPGWFADSDGVGFIRTEQINGKTEWVMMEHAGPGCITKFWTPFFYYRFNNRTGPKIKIYLDGSDSPVINDNFIELLTRNEWPESYGAKPKQQNSFQVRSPFADFTARAGNLYLPIPFAKSCKITMTAKPFYNIINYRGYPEGTKVETFTMDVCRHARTAFEASGKKLLITPEFVGGRVSKTESTIQPGKDISIKLPKGSAAIRNLELQLDSEAIKANSSALRSTVLVINCDGEQTVWVPLGDFFCSANAINPMQTWTRTVTTEGKLICRWVMPYKSNAVVSVKNLGESAVTLKLAVNVGAWRWDDSSMYFHANWRSDDILPGTPFMDWNFIDIKGKGVFVGDAWTVLNPGRGWWGEGDEKIYVDAAWDKKFPTHFGTGTEDYYGWAGGVNPTKQDVFSIPFLANASVGSTSENNSRGFNVCTRIRSLDAIPFKERLVFDIEASPGTQIRKPWNMLGYSSVVFWYALPGADSNRRPLPEAAARLIMSLEQLAERAKSLRK